MRISDWSSDVCSSDLLGGGLQSAHYLLHDRHPHGDVEIVEDMLGVRPHVPLKIADVPATIGHEGDLTVHPDALLQQQFMKATTRPVVMSDHEAEPARWLANFAILARIDDGLTHDHLEIVRPIVP